MSISPRAHLWVWVAIVLSAFALRVVLAERFVGLDSPPDVEAWPDQREYELYAYQMSIGNGYVETSGDPGIRRAPGTSLVLLPVYAVFGRSFAAGRIWFCLIGALTCLVVGWIGRLAFGRLTGIVAGAWLACYPSHFYYSMHLVSEPPYGLMLALSLALTISGLHSGRMRSHVAAGLCLGGAILIRPGLVFVVPIAFVLLALHDARRRALGIWLVHVLAAAVVVSPWLIRNKVVFGKAMFTTVGGHTFYGANNEKVLADAGLTGRWIPTSDLTSVAKPIAGNEIEREKAAWRYGLQFVRENWRHMPFMAFMKLYRLLKPEPSTPNDAVRLLLAIAWVIVLPFLLIGISLARRRRQAELFVLMLPLVALIAQAVVFYGMVRFREARAVAFLPVAAFGLVAVLLRLFPRLAESRDVAPPSL